MVALARGGDRRAGQVLLTRHYPMLAVLCRRKIRDETLAEDAAQEAAVHALLSLDRLQQPEKFGAWLSGIGLNICRRWLQYRTSDAWSLDRLIGGSAPFDSATTEAGLAEQMERIELRASIQQAVSELPPGQRAAVKLVYLDGLSHREAASSLNVATSAIKTRLFKARRTLRQRLHETWLEEYVTTTELTWVDFRVSDLRRIPGSDDGSVQRHSLILEEIDGKQRQAIWGIPPFAAEAIAIQLAGVEMPRPLPYTLTHQIVVAMGGSIREVRIPRVQGRFGVGELVIDSPTGERVIECRLSDAINLALLSSLPIRYDAAWLKDDEQGDSAEQLQQANDALYGPGTEGPAEIAAEVVEQFRRATAP
ncbi:MAG TPA: bifunctional nuclease domain-containing protein [Thermomicrobiales bacterium]|nr:bifunctional nuclease domain-containing protein [Thermomicrobiales bacterium]